MRYLSGEEEKNALEYIVQTARIAKLSGCQKSKCGSQIINDGEIVGIGTNGPPGDNEGQRRCSCSKEDYHKKVTDKTCCIHAEQRAIIDGLINRRDKMVGSRLYFVRLDEKGEPTRSGKPYCTICSKMALDVGISEFVLWHKEGIAVYDTVEYNDLSFNYKE